jgi:hypothetical protein
MDLTIHPEAHGGEYNHEFWLRLPPNTFACPGNYTRTLFDGNGAILEQVSGVFDSALDNLFKVIPSTSAAIPAMTNTIAGSPYVPTARTALLSIVFTNPCPFAFDFDPTTAVHGEGLFFSTRLYVVNTGQTIDPGDDRTLFVPVDWSWPVEWTAIWLAYPAVTPPAPPTFVVPWWQTKNMQYIYVKP